MTRVETIGGAVVHINRPSSTRFGIAVKERGCRKWHVLKGRHKSFTLAMAALGRAMVNNSDYRRGRIFFDADWYEPMLSAEIERP